MTLGEKLRKTRLEKGLTQTQVAGERITRNMLSQLENDLASPSVRTLEYLAQVLDVPMGWLLDQEAEKERLQLARAHYQNEAYGACMELLEEKIDCEEAALLLFRSRLQRAGSLLADGKVQAAKQLVCSAMEQERSLYVTQAERNEASVLLAQVQLLEGEIPEVAGRPPAEELRLLVAAASAIRSGQLDEADKLLRTLSEEEQAYRGGYGLLCGMIAVARQRYEEGILHLRQAEEDRSLGKLARMEIYRLLEQCYREREDYKTAYYYASLRLREA